MQTISYVAFDADDTLWANEDLFVAAQAQYVAMLAKYTEQRNLAYFGYGIKGFTLSMIETAIQITHGTITGHEIGQIIELARAMVYAPLELLPHVAEVIPALAQHYKLMLITKGDLFDQEAKIARSGLADYFTHIDVVSDKTPAAYARLLRRYDINPQSFVMVGNSLRSDVLPILAIGARAIHVPYHLTWQHEHVDVPIADRQWIELPDLHAVRDWFAQTA